LLLAARLRLLDWSTFGFLHTQIQVGWSWLSTLRARQQGLKGGCRNDLGLPFQAPVDGWEWQMTERLPERKRFSNRPSQQCPPVRLEELQGEVASLTRARDLSERAYKAGAIPLTDVLIADSQLLVARNDVESTRADAARAAVRTFRALGGGWDIRSNSSLTAVK
jgi:hypothetical protein